MLLQMRAMLISARPFPACTTPGAQLDEIAAQLGELGDWRSVVQIKAQAGTAWLAQKRFDLFDQRYDEAFALASGHGLVYLELIVRIQKAQFQLSSVQAGGIIDSIAAEARDKDSELVQSNSPVRPETRLLHLRRHRRFCSQRQQTEQRLPRPWTLPPKQPSVLSCEETGGLLRDWLGNGGPPYAPEPLAVLRGISYSASGPSLDCAEPNYPPMPT